MQNILSANLLSKNIKIKKYRTIILPVVLYGCETWSLALREERRLKVFENRVLRRIFEQKKDEKTGEWRRLLSTEPKDLYSTPNIIRVMKSRRMKLAGGVALCTGFWWENLREGNQLENLGVDGIILKWIFRKRDGEHGLY